VTPTTRNIGRPAIARVGYLGDAYPPIVFGYWQGDGSWRDAPRGVQGGGLENGIRKMLNRNERTVVVSVHSFSGADTLGHEYTREDLPENGGTIDLPTDPEHDPTPAAENRDVDNAKGGDEPGALVHVLIYDHRNGIDVGLYSTEQLVREGAAKIARRRWHQARELDGDLPEQPPSDDEATIELYVKATGYDESFGFDVCQVDADVAIDASGTS
jgi:hypothetical protein